MTHDSLALLLQAYLNQDWPYDYPNVWAAVDEFVQKEPPTQDLLDDISDVLRSMPSEEEIRRYILDDLDSNYLPEVDGYSMTGWLKALSDHVQQQL